MKKIIAVLVVLLMLTAGVCTFSACADEPDSPVAPAAPKPVSVELRTMDDKKNSNDDYALLTSKNQSFKVYIYFENASKYTVTSVILNDVVYGRDGLTANEDNTRVMFIADVGNKVGAVTYSVNSITYSADGTDKNISFQPIGFTVGVGKAVPTAVFSNIDATNSKVFFKANITDTDAAITDKRVEVFTPDGIKAAVIPVDGSIQVAPYLLSNTLYRLDLVASYNLTNGSEPAKNVILAQTNVRTKDMLRVSVPRISAYGADIAIEYMDADGLNIDVDKIELLTDGEPPREIDSDERTLKNLIAGKNYTVSVTIRYMLNGVKTLVTKSASFTTATLNAPTAEMSTPDFDDNLMRVKINLRVTDPDGLFILKSVSLRKDGATVKTFSQIQSVYEFTDLLNDSSYTLVLEYAYDVNDGKGEITVKDEKSFVTPTLSVPEYAVTSVTTDYSSLNFIIIRNDSDNIAYLNQIIITDKNGETVKEILDIQEGQNNTISDLLSDSDYRITVRYSYNLNNGGGVIVKELICIARTKAYSAPIIRLSGMNAVGLSVEFKVNTVLNGLPESAASVNTVLMRGGRIVHVFTGGTDDGYYSYADLHYGASYEIVATLSYDFADGNGVRTVSDTRVFITDALHSPRVELINTGGDKSSLSVELRLYDPDRTLTQIALLCYDETTVILGREEIDMRLFAYDFDELQHSAPYTFTVSYRYDLKDGLGEQSGTEQVYTFKTGALGEITERAVFTGVTARSFDLKFNLGDYDGVWKLTSGKIINLPDEILPHEYLLTESELHTLNNGGKITVKGLSANKAYLFAYSYSLPEGTRAGEKLSPVLNALTAPKINFSQNTFVSDNGSEIIANYGVDYSDPDGLMKDKHVQLLIKNLLTGEYNFSADGDFENGGVFGGLYNGREYRILISATYDLAEGGGVRSITQVYDFTTNGLVLPSVLLRLIDVAHNCAAYTLSALDPDNLINNFTLTLYYQGESLAITELIRDGVWENLLSDKVYSYAISYNYDSANGEGEKRFVETGDFRTLGVQEPKLALTDAGYTEDGRQVFFNAEITDANNLLREVYVELLLDGKLLDTVIIDKGAVDFTGNFNVSVTGESYTLMLRYSFADSVGGGEDIGREKSYTVVIPYLISDFDSFNMLRISMRDATLVADINCGGRTLKPIGNESSPYDYVFDGNGYSITNFKLETALGFTRTVGGNIVKYYYSGLFGAVSGDIRNLTVKNYFIDIDNRLGILYAGVLAADLKGDIVNCHDAGAAKESVYITGSDIYVGGLIGRTQNGAVRNCSSAAPMKIQAKAYSSSGAASGANIYAGGLIGASDGITDGCNSRSVIECTQYDAGYNVYAGGLIAYNRGNIVFSFASGSINVKCADKTENLNIDGYAGGLAAYSSGNIEQCYATGKVTVSVKMTAFAGGLIGYKDGGGLTFSYASGEVTVSKPTVTAFAGGLVGQNVSGGVHSCYAAGNVYGITCTGGLVGDNRGEITSSIAFGNVSGGSSLGRLVGGVEKSGIAKEGLAVDKGYIYAGQLVLNGICNNVGIIVGDKEVKDISWYESMNWQDGYNLDCVALGRAPSIGDEITPLFPDVTIGSPTKPLNVYTVEDLNKLRDNPTWHATLKNSLDLTGIEWEPIGTQTAPYNGFFNGGGKNIKGLNITSPYRYTGLFGVITGSVYNFTLSEVNINVTADNNLTDISVGAVAGANYGFVTAVGVLDLADSETGGVIAGMLKNDSIDSSVTVGGLIGMNYGDIANQEEIGIISDCYTHAAVTARAAGGTARAGGIAGYNEYGNINYCFTSGDITAQNTAGGELIADGSGAAIAGGIVATNDKSTVRSAFSTGLIKSDGKTGGLTGENIHQAVSVDSRIYEGQMYAGSKPIYSEELTDNFLTLSELNSADTYRDMGYQTSAVGDTPPVWSFEEGYYPYHSIGTDSAELKRKLQVTSEGGIGNPIRIGTASDFKKLSLTPEAYGILTANIDLRGEAWTPIGSMERPYNGVFNGNGYTVSNVKLTDSGEAGNNIGVFGVNTGRIDNVRFTKIKYDFTVNGHERGYSAGVIGQNYYGTITRVQVVTDMPYVRTGAAYPENVGGLVGKNHYGVIENSSVAGSAQSGNIVGLTNVGGLVGRTVYGTIRQCFTDINVIATGTNQPRAGGLIGYNDYAAVSDSFALGNLKSDGTVGGVIGTDNNGNYRNLFRYENQSMMKESINNQNGNIIRVGESSAMMKMFYDKQYLTTVVKLSEEIWDMSNLSLENGILPVIKI